MSETIWTKTSGNAYDREYNDFLVRLNERFRRETEGRPLFEVYLASSGVDPFELWLAQFPNQERQSHNCNTCKSFLRHYGRIGIIDPDGTLRSPLWFEEDAPELYKPSVRALERAVRRGKVLRPFKEGKRDWGVQETGPWHHMALVGHKSHLHISLVETPDQWSAGKVQEFKNVQRALDDFSLQSLNTVVALLESEELYRSEKLLGAATWLRDLKQQVEQCGGQRAENTIWFAVATAPAGFCHPRSGMLSTLLDDIANCLPWQTVKKRFADKMHPLKYQRPQAAPSAGTVAQAEKLFAGLGLETALRRRYARVEEINAIWRPKQEQELMPVGVFSSLLKPAEERPEYVFGASKNISWVKFLRDALPSATGMKLLIPNQGAFCAYVTAVDPSAGALFQWDADNLRPRNPFSWYLLYGGSYASRWHLTPGSWADVTALSYIPAMWGERPLEHLQKGVLFALEGCKPPPCSNLALFPETLRSELHGVRSVIEAYSKTRPLEGAKDATACGLLMNESGLNTRIKLSNAHYSAVFSIDRWE
jgi:hypothetical protein